MSEVDLVEGRRSLAKWKEHEASSKQLGYYSDVHQFVATEESGHNVVNSFHFFKRS